MKKTTLGILLILTEMSGSCVPEIKHTHQRII